MMLEFEDNQTQMRANVEAPTGFVVIPIEQYNELLIAANSVPRVKVKVPSYAKYPRIEVYVDHEWLYKFAVKALHERFSEEELAGYDIKEADEVYINSMTIAEATEEVRAAIDLAKQSGNTEPDPF